MFNNAFHNRYLTTTTPFFHIFTLFATPFQNAARSKLSNSSYADRIPAIAEVWGWHGGAAPTENE
jgi:hypothetical protein